MKKLLQNNVFLEFIILLLLAIPCVSHANPIIFAGLYSPFSSDFIEHKASLIIMTIGLTIELILILHFIGKYVNQDQKKKAFLRIATSIIALNIFTMLITQAIALFIGIFSEIFPIIIEYYIIYLIFKKASRKELLAKMPSAKNVFMIVFFANLLSFSFGLAIHYPYSNCEKYYDYGFMLNHIDPDETTIEKAPGYCFNLPGIGKEFKEAKKSVDMKKIEECEKLDIVGDKQFNCYVNYAVQNGDIELCKLARKEGNYEDGNYYESSGNLGDWKDICYYDVAIKTLNSEVCGRIPYIRYIREDHCQIGNDLKYKCYYEVAIAKKEDNICNKIKQSNEECEWIRDMREKCQSNILMEQIEEIDGHLDSDNDGLSDKIEFAIGTDRYFADTDNDGFSDYEELRNGYHPLIVSPNDKINEDIHVLVQKILLSNENAEFADLNNLKIMLADQALGDASN